VSRKSIAAVIFFSLSVVTIATAFVTVDVAIAQAPASTPTAQPTVTPTPGAAILPCVTQPELLSAYKEVLDSSEAAINNVQSTTKTVLWLVGAAFTLLTAEGLGGLWLMQKATQEVAKSMQEVRQARQHATEAAQEVAEVKSVVSEVQNTYKDLKEQADRTQEQIEVTSVELSKLGADIDWYKHLMLLDQIRNHALRLFREDQIEWEDAVNSLREQLEHEDPIARWYIVRALQVWAECDPRGAPELESRIEQILESLVDSEPERLVRLEAERALRALRRRGGENQE
jgi:hypothetical protein